MTEGHLTAHLNRCAGDCDAGPQDASFNACGESARNTDHLYSRRRASCSGWGRADLPRAESAWLADRPENLLCMGPPVASQRDLWDIVITEILAGYYEPDELVLAPLTGSCSPLCSRL